MKITELVDLRCIRVPLAASEKTAAITELVDMLGERGLLEDREIVLQAVLDRERTRSTGIGLGLAVPHGKSHGCRRLTMAIGKPASPLEFGAIDGKPCRMVVLLTSPADETGPHIQALAGISRLWQNEAFRAAALAAETADDLHAAIETHQS